MQIEKASETGFCFGVRRAWKIVEEAVQEHSELETLGPLVHNQQAIDSLRERGIKTVENIDQIQGSTVVIPSHGVSPQVIEDLQSRGKKIIDATCPNVQKAQRAARELSEKGFQVIVYGKPSHTEVKGVLGWAGSDAIATLDSDLSSKFDKLPPRIGFVSQTTKTPDHFLDFLHSFTTSYFPQIKELSFINTICDVTKRRQEAALELTKRVDLMIVVGGQNSSNTRCLAEICSAAGIETHHIETAAEIEESWLKGRNRIGVTTGTSTLDQTTDEVIIKLEELTRI